MSDELQRVRAKAMELLARREHSRAELRSKLATRGFDTEPVEQALDELEASDLLSETRFAEAFVTARARRGQGPRRLRAELAQRGVDAAAIEQALAESGVDWPELAADVRRRKFGAGPPADIKDRAKQTRFLEYRGFETDDIRQALAAD